MPNNVNVRVGVTGAKEASTDVDKLRDKFDKLKKEGAKGLAIGAGLAVGQKAFNAIEGAIEGVVHVGEQAVEVAIQQEHSIGKLNQSLKANVEGWNGNTGAIEGTIRAQEKLGFTDIEQRNSLSLLVAATHDVNKALEVQRVAMDLARFKNISLQEASEALTKVEAGRFRVLASLGIQLKAGATATDALAAVEKVANGQAEEFANTTEGKLLVAQVKVNDAMEKFGKTVMPLVAEAANVVTEALDRTTVPLEKLKEAAEHGPPAARVQLEDLTKAAEAHQVSVEDLYNAWSGSGQSIEEAAKSLGGTVDHALDGMSNKTADFGVVTGETAGAAADGFGKIGSAAVDASRATDGALKDMSDAADGLVDKLISDTEKIITGYYDVIIEQDQLAATNAKIAAAKRVLASKTATAAEKADARTALHQLSADRIKYLEDLASAGKSNTKEFKTGMKGLLDELKTAHGAERTAILAEIRALELLATKARIAKIGFANLANIGLSGARASGGPVKAHHAYLVNENTPRSEVFVPDEDGEILTGADKPSGSGSGPSGGGSSGSMNLTINVSAGAWSPGQAEQWARQVTPHIAREFQRQGLIAR